MYVRDFFTLQVFHLILDVKFLL